MSFGNKIILSSLLLSGTLSVSSAGFAQDSTVANADAQAKDELTKEKPKATAATKDLGGTATSPKNTKGVPVKKVSAQTDKANKQTAKAINKIPGVNIQAADLQPPADDPPITGFHPIKKLMRPVIRLGKGAVEIQQSMMKLSGPIAGLQPSMTALGNKMTSVDHQISHMQGQMKDMNNNFGQIDQGLNKVGTRLDEVSQDVQGMTHQVEHLTVPVKALNAPLNDLLEPLRDIKRPMGDVKHQLSDLHMMLHGVLIAIVVAVLAIVVGTPFAAIYVWRNRKKLFPHLQADPEHDKQLRKHVEQTLSAVHN